MIFEMQSSNMWEKPTKACCNKFSEEVAWYKYGYFYMRLGRGGRIDFCPFCGEKIELVEVVT